MQIQNDRMEINFKGQELDIVYRYDEGVILETINGQSPSPFFVQKELDKIEQIVEKMHIESSESGFINFAVDAVREDRT